MTVSIRTRARRCGFKTLSVMLMALLLGACSSHKQNTSGVSNILLDPFVVNLRNTDSLGIERYICIDLNLVLKTPQTAVANHSKIREAVIFFLNSKTSDDVDTLEKIQELRDQLFLLIAPYMDGNLKAIEIKNVMVTSLKEAINSFLAQAAQIRETGKK